MRNQNFCPIKFWFLVTRLMCCHIIQLNQLTVSLHGSWIQCTGAPSWVRGRSRTASSGSSSLFYWLSRNMSTPQSLHYLLIGMKLWQVYGCKSSRNMYSFQKAVGQHMWNLTSEQTPQSLSKRTGHIMEQVFSQTMSFKSLGLAVHEQLEEKTQSMPTIHTGHCILYCDVSSPFHQ